MGNVPEVKLASTAHSNSLENKIKWLINGGALAVLKACHFLELNNVYPTTLDKVDFRRIKYTPNLTAALIEYLIENNRADLVGKVKEDAQPFKERVEFKPKRPPLKKL